MNKTNSFSATNQSAQLTMGILLEKKFLNHSLVRMRLSNVQLVKSIHPGQFINIKVTDSFFPLLRRPFSVHRINRDQGWFEILFKIIGTGTKLLAGFQLGAKLDFIAPLGNSFIVSEKLDYALIVAGGLGIAPLLFLTQELKTKNVATILYWGNRTKHDLTIISDFENLGIELHLASDDGSSGFKGTVTELLQAKLNNYNEAKIEIFACGPNPMLNELKKISADKKISCQISLETMMACGFGVCLGCNITSNFKSETYKYVCKHGPVFDSGEIELGA